MHLKHVTLPDDVLFSRLLKLATENQDQVIVDDHSHETQFGYRHILHGTVRLVQKLQDLDQSISDHRGGFFIAVLAPNATGALPAEAAYLLQQCNASHLLVGPEQVDLATKIREVREISAFTIESQDQDVSALLPLAAFTLDASLAVDEECPSILFYTSGTTGPPKGVLHARRTINKYARMPEEESNDAICIIPSGAFWSVYFTEVFQMLLTGVRIEIRNFGRNYNLIWEKLRERTATKMVFSPTFWRGMMLYFQNHISKLPESIVQEYIQGARHLRDVTATGAMPSKMLKEFWKNILGRPLKVLYGTTETQAISVCDGEAEVTEDDLGIPLLNAVMMLEGDEGELLVKTPSLFLGYLNCPEATAERLDPDGFYKTGDLVKRQNGKFLFQGRANMDLFKFYAYKVPRVQVEASLTALPYIQEGYIMPVADLECDTRTAALVRLRDGTEEVDLERIRTDLSSSLPAYQLPTVLRQLGSDESAPRTWSEKFAIKTAIQQFFPLGEDGRLYDAGIEVMDVSTFMQSKITNLWDFSGMRA